MREPELNWVDETIAFWIKTGIQLNTGAALDTIEKVERELHFSFPNDFKELYQAVDGFAESDWNEHMFSLWSLERIIDEYREEEDYHFWGADFVGFCDYLISSHGIGFSRTKAGIFKHYALKEPIANTFREAIVLINENSDSIY